MNKQDINERIVQDARVITQAGTLMDTLTPEEQAATAKLVKTYIDDRGYTLGQVAKQSGISEATISQVLSGRYPGDMSGMVRKLRTWLDVDTKKQTRVKFEGFVLTKVARYIAGALDFANKVADPENPANIAVIYGPAGWGKSLTAQTWAAKNLGLYHRVDEGQQTPRAFLQALCRTLRIDEDGLTQRLIVRITEKMKSSGRMIILDEAHKLIGQRSLNLRVFETIRDIHDITGCPIALIGTSKMVRAINEGLRETKGWIADQFSSRVCVIMDIIQAVKGGDGGRFAFTSQELTKILGADKLKLHPAAIRELAMFASIPSRGGLRKVKTVIGMIQTLYPGQEITIERIKAVYQQLSPGETWPDFRRIAPSEFEQDPPSAVAAAG